MIFCFDYRFFFVRLFVFIDDRGEGIFIGEREERGVGFRVFRVCRLDFKGWLGVLFF